MENLGLDATLPGTIESIRMAPKGWVLPTEGLRKKVGESKAKRDKLF